MPTTTTSKSYVPAAAAEAIRSRSTVPAVIAKPAALGLKLA